MRSIGNILNLLGPMIFKLLKKFRNLLEAMVLTGLSPDWIFLRCYFGDPWPVNKYEDNISFIEDQRGFSHSPKVINFLACLKFDMLDKHEILYPSLTLHKFLHGFCLKLASTLDVLRALYSCIFPDFFQKCLEIPVS